MITGITWDDSRLMANFEQAKRNARRANWEHVRWIADQIITDIFLKAPRDTNRFVRAWLQAANQAKVGDWALPDLEESKLNRRYEQILLGQKRIIARLIRGLQRRIDQWFVQRGRPITGWALKAQEKIEEYRQDLQRIEGLLAALREGNSLILLDAGAHNIFAYTDDTFAATDVRVGVRRSKAKKPRKPPKRVFVRGYDKPLGGMGQVYIDETTVVVRLHNAEPHARIVESRERLLSAAVLKAKAFGGNVHKGELMTVLRHNTTWLKGA